MNSLVWPQPCIFFDITLTWNFLDCGERGTCHREAPGQASLGSFPRADSVFCSVNLTMTFLCYLAWEFPNNKSQHMRCFPFTLLSLHLVGRFWIRTRLECVFSCANRGGNLNKLLQLSSFSLMIGNLHLWMSIKKILKLSKLKWEVVQQTAKNLLNLNLPYNWPLLATS